MTPQEQITKIIEVIENAVNAFHSKIPGIQLEIAGEMDKLIRGLDLNNDKVSNTVKNLKTIGQIQSKINSKVMNPEYVAAVKDLVKAFNQVATLQNKYFESINAKFGANELLNEIKSQSINSVVQGLTEGGLQANITNKLQDILRANITSGASYGDLKSQLDNFITANNDTVGALERYTTQLVTDGLNRFNGQYMQTLTTHLGLKWHIYTGSNITTTRQFCELLKAKKYVYDAELSDIIQGDIDGHQCEIYNKTGLPKGLVDGTNVNNFQVYRGGYSCGHQYSPLVEEFVPLSVRLAAYAKYNIPHDKDGFAIAP